MLSQTQVSTLSLDVRDVTKKVSLSTGELTILKNIDLSVKKGESCAIVGRSGSGKTTLLGILAGIDTPSSGEVFSAGKALTNMNEDARAAFREEHVGFVFQSFHLIEHLTALENVMLPMQLRGPKKSGGKGEFDPKAQASSYLEKLGLASRVAHYPRQLSGGEQQRVAIARAFACQPSILFADEPTGNLDQATGDEIVRLLFALNEEADTTLVLVTHDMALADQCDQTVVLESGVINVE